MKEFKIGERYYMWKYTTIKAKSMDEAIKKFRNNDYDDDDVKWGDEEVEKGTIIANPNKDFTFPDDVVVCIKDIIFKTIK